MSGSERALNADRPLSPGPTRVAPAAATGCEIRVIASVAELVESYRLRYEVYRTLGYLQRFNGAELEIDEYDLSAIPFGAFDVASGTLVGTLRLITTERQADYARMISHVLGEVSDSRLTEQAMGAPARPLPAIVSDEIDREIAAFNSEGFTVHELSRFIVRPGHRGGGISRGLALMGFAQAIRFGPAVIIAGCLPEHNQMYARYGFSKLPHTGLDHFDSVGQIANTIVSRTDMLPQPTQSHVEELLFAMASGIKEHALELGRDTHALYRFGTAPRRFKRETLEW